MFAHVLLLASSIFVQGVVSLTNVAVRDPVHALQGVPERRLSAAKKSDKLGRRDAQDYLRYNHELHYLDADTAGSDSPFGAKATIEFKTPALLLEDIEHHIKAIDCLGSRIYLYFSSSKALNHAHKEFQGVDSFLLITSHEGCNEDGERDSHLVSEAVVNAEDQVVVLSTTRLPWKHAFHSLTLDFGKIEDSLRLEPRRQGGLLPRQAGAASATAGSSAASTSYAYPTAPSSTATSINVVDNINGSYIDTTILPPDPLLGQISASGPKLSAGFNIKCRSCTFQGSINLVAGSLTTGPFTSDDTGGFINETDAVINYIENGFVEFRSNGFNAHVELDNTIEASSKLESFTVPLPTIPITPLLIPGIASVGPQFEPALTAGFQLKANLEFGYGFEVIVPNNSSLVLNLANRTNSSQQGFENTAIKALPFRGATPNIELILTAGFSPSLLLGISFFNGKAIAGAGFFLDTPMLTTTLSTVSHVDSNCNNASSSTAKKAIFDTLTHIDASAEIGLGVIAQAEVNFAGDGNLQDVAKYAILTKTFDLPTGCVSFDAAAKTYGAAGAATGTAAAGAKPSKSVGSRTALGRGEAGLGRATVAFGALVAFCAGLVFI